MRLIRTPTHCPETVKLNSLQRWGSEIPPYAILSHLWSPEPEHEVLLSDIQNGTHATKPAYFKFKNALEAARADGYEWMWIDTCCIDKSSSVELTEAINSMYGYYKNAQKCYAYLSDVKGCGLDMAEFEASKWWTRGWTLQELLAPNKVEFFGASWNFLGTKHGLHQSITKVTGIGLEYLDGSSLVQSASIARRMSWAALRSTTREEDTAYSLIGLFDVNMPMLYGEGATKAFLRLQEEIMKLSEDQSLFAWRKVGRVGEQRYDYHGLLADSPLDFEHAGAMEPYSVTQYSPSSMTARGLRIKLPLTTKPEGVVLAALACPDTINYFSYGGWLAVYLRTLPGASADQYARINCESLASVQEIGEAQEIFIRQHFSESQSPAFYLHSYFQIRSLKLENSLALGNPGTYEIVSSASMRCKTEGPDAPIAAPQSWSKMPLVHKIDRTRPYPTTELLIRRTWDSESFLLVLGPRSNHYVSSVVLQASELMPMDELRVKYLSSNWSSTTRLPYHDVEVSFEERAQVGRMIHFVDIRVTATLQEGWVRPEQDNKSSAIRGKFKKILAKS